MRIRRINIGIVSVIVVSSLMLICYMALGHASLPNTLAPENGPVTIRVQTDKSLYTLQEIVEVKLYLINHENETINLTGGITISYWFINSEGEGLGRIKSQWLVKEYPIVLPPQGEILFETYEWSQKIPVITDSGYSWTDAGPGIYTIKVTVKSSAGTSNSEITIEIKG